MGIEEESAVSAFLGEFESDQSDLARYVDRVLSHMSSDARFHVNAWEDPLVGHDAIRDELLRQASHFHDLHIEIVAIASAGQIVFTERLDVAVQVGADAFTAAGERTSEP